MNRLYTFGKQERLSGKKIIDLLFKDGSSFFSHPFTVLWHFSPGTSAFPSRLGISVPKKNFKKAVDRNLIKRITREAWRYNKKSFYNTLEQHNIQIVIMLIYNGREKPSIEDMNKYIKKLITKLSIHIEKGEER